MYEAPTTIGTCTAPWSLGATLAHIVGAGWLLPGITAFLRSDIYDEHGRL
jgi:hypothetical protein